MNLPTGIDSDLVPGGNGQARVVSRAVVHETFAGSRIGLLIDCALEGNLLGHSGLEITGVRFVHEKEIRGFGARSDIGTGSRKTVLQVGTSERFCVERLDVEDDGDDVQLEPETGAKVGCLVNFQLGFESSCEDISKTHLSQKAHGDASTKEFAQVLGGELAKAIDDMRFNSVRGLFRVIRVDIDGP